MLLEKPSVIKRWIDANETYIRHRYRLTIKQKHIGQTTIDDFFQQKPIKKAAPIEPPAAPDPERTASERTSNTKLSESDEASDSTLSS